MMLATKAKGPEFYDQAAARPGWRVPYWQSEYLTLWAHLLLYLPDSILEWGCGTGRLAAFLRACGVRSYRGIDFSPECIRVAREYAPGVSFDLANIYGTQPVRGECVLATEVLEHLEDDVGALLGLPSGTQVVFTLPTFGDPSHLRTFQTTDDVQQRYGHMFSNLLVERHDELFFIGRGVR